MANLQNVIEQLTLNKIAQDETTEKVGGLNTRVSALITSMKLNNMDMLEALREKSAPSSPAGPAAAAQGSGGGGGGMGFLGGVTALGALGTTLLAIGASITGLDDEIRALKIGDTLIRIGKAIARAVNAVMDFGRGVVNVFAKLGPAVTAIREVFTAGFAKIPESVFEFFGKIKSSILTTIPESVGRVQGSVTEFFKPLTDFFGRVSEFMKPIFSGVGTTFETFGKVFGSILDFFKSALAFIDPVLGPLKTVLKTALRPFFQIVLTIVDFVMGFFKGFTGEDGSFMEKLTAGIEGGIKGVIKGITEALDIIFIELPAWIMGKLGFDGLAAKIKEFNITQFVDPIFEAIKKFFKDMFAGELSLPSIDLGGMGDMAGDLIKSILRKVLPDPNGDFSLLDPRYYAKAAIPDSIYEYAGYSRVIKDGKVGKLSLQNDAAAGNTATIGAAPPTGTGGATIVNAPSSRGGDTISSNSSNAIVAPMAASHDPTLGFGAAAP